MRSALLCFVIVAVLSFLAQAQTVPVFTITPVESTITYYVKASVKITGTFDKWDASLTFTSPDVTTGVVDVKIQAASVHSGSKKEDDMLKSEDGF
ncbi:MAG TPA: YceI family protein, partial [Terriglobales bacterium]